MNVAPSADPGRGRLRWILPLLFIAALWALGLPALGQYNVSWDEALGDLFFGERYLSFFLGFDPSYLDFQGEPYPEGRRPDLGISPFRVRPWEYYPFAATLAAATSEVLSRHLGLLDPYDGFHAVNLLFASALVWSLFAFVERRYGLLAAAVAVGFLFTSPRIVCHLMANIKDFPLMALYAITAFVFLDAWEKGSALRLLAAGALLGLTLATKANAMFFPAIPALLALAGGVPEAWKGRGAQLLLTLLLASLLSLVVMVAVWPYLWADPLARLGEHLQYILFVKGVVRPESEAPVLAQILLTTPPVFLGCFALGLHPCLRAARRGDAAALLLPVWILVAMSRFLTPQATNFDGVRHFLEIFPPMAVIAALGVEWIGSALARRSSSPVRRRRVEAAVAALALAPSALAVLSTHPFQIAYWNVFVGGYAGARARDLPQASDYWGMSYRLGLEWMNRNAPPDAMLAVPVAEHAVRLVAPERLRSDIHLHSLQPPHDAASRAALEATSTRTPRRTYFVMFVERRDWMAPLMRYCLDNLQPEAVWELEGEPVLSIYRYAEAEWQTDAEGRPILEIHRYGRELPLP